MKYVKFLMRNKEMNMTLSFEQAERVLNSPNQLVMLTGTDGKWNGDTLNKAEIIGTVRDYEKEKYEGYNPDQLPEPKRILPYADIQDYKPDFLRRDKTTTKGVESLKDLM